jgi:hypothetical protein
MNIDYKNKYLKYKTKYLELKKNTMTNEVFLKFFKKKKDHLTIYNIIYNYINNDGNIGTDRPLEYFTDKLKDDEIVEVRTELKGYKNTLEEEIKKEEVYVEKCKGPKPSWRLSDCNANNNTLQTYVQQSINNITKLKRKLQLLNKIEGEINDSLNKKKR